jgi:hypothetical protein
MAKRETSRRVKPQRGGGPLIAIVGGADSTRTDYEPPVMHHDIARQAARALGAELAAQGCRIIVYSTEPSFIESDVVQGFLQGAPAGGQELIQVRFPYGAETGRFGETAAQEKLFEYLPDTDRSWEAGFYRSLADADGVLLLGGGRSTLIVGHVAIAQRIPISALATFGGAARTIWHSHRPEKDLVSEVEWRAMARPEWRREYAAEIVAGLRSHAMRRREAKARNEDAEQQKTLLTTWRAVLSGVLFVAAFGMAAGGNSLLPGTFWFEFVRCWSGLAPARQARSSARLHPPSLPTLQYWRPWLKALAPGRRRRCCSCWRNIPRPAKARKFNRLRCSSPWLSAFSPGSRSTECCAG